MQNTKAALSALFAVTLFTVFAVSSCGRDNGAGDRDGDAGRGRGKTSAASAIGAGLGIDAIADAAEKTIDSVVNISTTRMVHTSDPFFDNPLFQNFFGQSREQTRKTPEQSLGSGVIVDKNGIILTNNHVVEGAEQLKVTLHDDRTFEATVIGGDPESDLAVIQLKKRVDGLKPLPFGDSDVLRLGEIVLAIGNPFGLGHTVTMGIVSAKGRSNVGITDYEDFIQTDAAINPGNSGGALVNLRGELVGINTAIASRSGGNQGVGFAIPSNMARGIVDGLEKKGKIVRGWLGIGIRDVTPDLAEAMNLVPGKGVLIDDVYRDSPGSKAGLRAGDVILGVGNEETNSVTRLRNRIAALGAGKRTTLRILRDRRQMNVTVRLEERPGGGRLAYRGGTESGSDLGGLTVVALNTVTRREYGVAPEVVSGVIVTGVGNSGPAATAALRQGDVILEINRKPVVSVEMFTREYKRSRGKTLLYLFRDGKRSFAVVEK